MTDRRRLGQRCRGIAAAMCVALSLASCNGEHSQARPAETTAATPTAKGDCGNFSIAYVPGNGYEASAFLIGSLAERQLGCTVAYVRTTSKNAWQLVATGGADVYLDAYGAPGLRKRLATKGGPVTVVGPNGMHGVVDMVAPYFMGQRGLDSARDLPEAQKIGWGTTVPTIATTPELIALAQAFVDFQDLGYTVRNYNEIAPVKGMGALLQQAGRDDANHVPGVYLAEGPRALVGDPPGQKVLDVPGSAAQPCETSPRSTLCSFDDFDYEKIANTEFARSGSPAYALVYNYRLDRASAANILELVALSGNHVGPPDVASWLNTHANVWRRWLP